MVQHMSPFMLHLWILELLQLPSGAIWNFRWMYSSKKPTKDVSWRHVSWGCNDATHMLQQRVVANATNRFFQNFWKPKVTVRQCTWCSSPFNLPSPHLLLPWILTKRAPESHQWHCSMSNAPEASFHTSILQDWKEWKDRVRDIGGPVGFGLCLNPADPVVASQAPSQLRILIMFTEPWLRDFTLKSWTQQLKVLVSRTQGFDARRFTFDSFDSFDHLHGHFQVVGVVETACVSPWFGCCQQISRLEMQLKPFCMK